MTFDAFVEKYEGKTWGYPNDSDYRGECLSLSKHHIKEVYGINPPASGCNGARCYWSIFPNPLGTVLKKIPNTPDLIPERGWIVVWNGNTGGGYGHIASILSATKDSFVSLDQNYGGKEAHRVTHNYSNVYGFLAPLNSSEGDNMSDLQACLDSHAKLMKEIETKDKIISELTADKERYKAERDQARTERDNYAKKIEDQDKTIFSQKEDIKTLEGELSSCQDELEDSTGVEEDFEGFEINGISTSEVLGNKKITKNYTKKEI